MEELEDFAERLRADVEARCGCQVHKKVLSNGGYHLYNPMVFAYIRRVIYGRVAPDRCFPIQAEEKYAIKAGVADLANRHDDNGWWNEPATYWDVLESDHQSYNRAVRALSKICQVR